jgi:hypothetical protein
MNSNRRWVAMAFLAFGVLVWILLTKFIATVMGWIGIEEFDFHLVGDRFTLTTLLGLLIGGGATLYCYRHPTLSTLMNEVDHHGVHHGRILGSLRPVLVGVHGCSLPELSGRLGRPLSTIGYQGYE